MGSEVDRVAQTSPNTPEIQDGWEGASEQPCKALHNHMNMPGTVRAGPHDPSCINRALKAFYDALPVTLLRLLRLGRHTPSGPRVNAYEFRDW